MIAETPFINGYTLSYPIGYFPQLFAVVKARTKKAFVAGLLAMEDEKKGGEGIPEDVIIELIRVGLLHKNATATTEEATELVQDYLVSYGHAELDKKIVDAFVDSGLYDRATVAKQREFAAQIEKISEEREIALIKKAQAELDRLNNAIDVLIDAAIQESLISASDIPGKEEIPEDNPEDYIYGDEYESDEYYGDDDEEEEKTPVKTQYKQDGNRITQGRSGNTQLCGPGGQGSITIPRSGPAGQDRSKSPRVRAPYQEGPGIQGSKGKGIPTGPSPVQAEPIIRRRRPRPGVDPLEPPEIRQRT